MFTQAGVDLSKRVLIHGDFTMNNMLVDPDTNQLTAVLDFDFSHVGSPAHLFFTSLQSLGTSTDPTGGKLTKALLTGSFKDVRGMSEEGKSIWMQARVLDKAMATRGSVRPSEVQGLETLNRLTELERLICPFRLAVPMFLEKKTKAELAHARLLAEQALVNQLGFWGY
ncbi:Phosphotransferase enzyme family protein [Penicillium verhagenii]|nr:Phosphotransferase enzyme family protein [Penicillium verhagenii]